MRPVFLSLLVPISLLVPFTGMAQAQPIETTINKPPQTKVTGPQIMLPPQFKRGPRPVGPAAQIKQDTKDFIATINQHLGFAEMQRWIYGARLGYFGGNAWWTQTTEKLTFSIQVDSIDVGPVEGRTAQVTLKYRFQFGPGLDAQTMAELEKPMSETLALRLGADPFSKEEIWQIVPPESEQAANESMVAHHYLNYVTYYLAQKGSVQNGPVQNPRARASMSNLKQLSLGVMMFLQDWNERYAFAPEYLHDAIFPYIKNEKVFLLPGSDETYSFNANLSDTSIVGMKEPSKIVLLYEGEDEKPNFRYDGKAAVAFADGHVVLVSPDEAKALVWKP